MADRRRKMGFWQTFNEWWSTFYNETGSRPRKADLERFREENAAWKPELTLEDLTRHAKGRRDPEKVKRYFREYRSKMKGGKRQNGYSSSSGDSDEDHPSESKQVKRQRQRPVVPSFPPGPFALLPPVAAHLASSSSIAVLAPSELQELTGPASSSDTHRVSGPNQLAHTLSFEEPSYQKQSTTAPDLIDAAYFLACEKLECVPKPEQPACSSDPQLSPGQPGVDADQPWQHSGREVLAPVQNLWDVGSTGLPSGALIPVRRSRGPSSSLRPRVLACCGSALPPLLQPPPDAPTPLWDSLSASPTAAQFVTNPSVSIGAMDVGFAMMYEELQHEPTQPGAVATDVLGPYRDDVLADVSDILDPSEISGLEHWNLGVVDPSGLQTGAIISTIPAPASGPANNACASLMSASDVSHDTSSMGTSGPSAAPVHSTAPTQMLPWPPVDPYNCSGGGPRFTDCHGGYGVWAAPTYYGMPPPWMQRGPSRLSPRMASYHAPDTVWRQPPCGDVASSSSAQYMKPDPDAQPGSPASGHSGLGPAGDSAAGSTRPASSAAETLAATYAPPVIPHAGGRKPSETEDKQCPQQLPCESGPPTEGVSGYYGPFPLSRGAFARSPRPKGLPAPHGVYVLPAPLLPPIPGSNFAPAHVQGTWRHPPPTTSWYSWPYPPPVALMPPAWANGGMTPMASQPWRYQHGPLADQRMHGRPQQRHVMCRSGLGEATKQYGIARCSSDCTASLDAGRPHMDSSASDNEADAWMGGVFKDPSQRFCEESQEQGILPVSQACQAPRKDVQLDSGVAVLKQAKHFAAIKAEQEAPSMSALGPFNADVVCCVSLVPRT